MYIEVLVVGAIIIFIYLYRKNSGNTSYKFIAKTVGSTYEKYAPYSFKVVQEKARELGQEYSSRQYVIQVTVYGVVAAFVAYLYFYSIIWCIVYALAAIAFVPYLSNYYFITYIHYRGLGKIPKPTFRRACSF